MKQSLIRLIAVAGTAVMAAAGWTATSDIDAITFADFTRINHIASSNTHVYFATTEGIIRFNKLQNRWEDPLTGAEGIDNRDVRRIWVDLFDERLYAQTSLGEYEYDILFAEWFPIGEIPSIQTNGVHIQPPTMMYPPAGYNYAPEGFLIDRHARDFYFSDVLDDRSGNLWIGTWGYGPLMASSASGELEFLTFGLIQNRVDAIYDDGGVLWIGGSSLGGFRTGITIFDTDENTFSHIESGVGEGLPYADVNCLGGDSDYIYVGTDQGLHFLERDTRQVTRTVSGHSGLADDRVLSVATSGDSLFVGTENGMNLITIGGDSVRYVRPRQFFNISVYDFEVTDTSIWIASSAGAYQLLFGSGRLQKFQDPHSIIFNNVYRIERFNRYLWLVSDGGMVRLNLATGETAPFPSTMRGLYRRAMAVGEEIAAVASGRGLTIYFLGEDQQVTEREFTRFDGLPSEDITCLHLDGDYLWVGSERGLTRFLWNDPRRVD